MSSNIKKGDIVLKLQDNTMKKMKEIYKSYESLQYQLICLREEMDNSLEFQGSGEHPVAAIINNLTPFFFILSLPFFNQVIKPLRQK